MPNRLTAFLNTSRRNERHSTPPKAASVFSPLPVLILLTISTTKPFIIEKPIAFTFRQRTPLQTSRATTEPPFTSSLTGRDIPHASIDRPSPTLTVLATPTTPKR